LKDTAKEQGPSPTNGKDVVASSAVDDSYRDGFDEIEDELQNNN